MITIRNVVHTIKEWIARRPLFDGRVRVYLTLRCNVACPYCVNTHVDDGVHLAEYGELEPEVWIRILTEINRDCVITGGEPFLYAGLSAVVDAISEKHRVTIYTNLFCDMTGYRDVLTKDTVSLYISYHHDMGDSRRFSENLLLLKHWNVRFVVHLVSVLSDDEQKRIVQTFRETHGITLICDHDQRTLFHEASAKESRKRVLCNRRIILVAPDGKRYQCVSHMVRRMQHSQDLQRESLGDVEQSYVCDDYGYCAPCDGLGETKQKPLQ